MQGRLEAVFFLDRAQERRPGVLIIVPYPARSIIYGLLFALHVGSAHAYEWAYKDEIELALRAAVAVGDSPEPCRSTIGKKTALTLVRYCRAVSQATHPPCNTGNDCALIVEEIKRSCRPASTDVLPCSNSGLDWNRISRLPAQSFCATYRRGEEEAGACLFFERSRQFTSRLVRKCYDNQLNAGSVSHQQPCAQGLAGRSFVKSSTSGSRPCSRSSSRMIGVTVSPCITMESSTTSPTIAHRRSPSSTCM